MEDAEHIQYLGTFVVSGRIWRGDLFQREDGYWAEHVVTDPDGSWVSANHRLLPDNEFEAAAAAVSCALAYLEREGMDTSVMTIIHYAPAMANMTGMDLAASASIH